MNESTEGVTLHTGFIFDLLSCYEASRETFAAELFEMAEGLDPSRPEEPAAMALYNQMCAWIESELGAANLRRAGQAIGRRVWQGAEAAGAVGETTGPEEILAILKAAADAMIHDPEGRGWDILSSEPGRVVLRRTQTFNCILQEGLLESLAKATGAHLVRVTHRPCTCDGAEFCEYRVTWIPD